MDKVISSGEEIIKAKIPTASQDDRRRDRKIKFKAFVKDCDNKKKDGDFDPVEDLLADEKPRPKRGKKVLPTT